MSGRETMLMPHTYREMRALRKRLHYALNSRRRFRRWRLFGIYGIIGILIDIQKWERVRRRLVSRMRRYAKQGYFCEATEK